MTNSSSVSPATQPIAQLLSGLWRHISARRRKQFALLFVLMTMASFAEVLSIGAVIPFLGMLTAPEAVFSHPAAQPLIELLGITRSEQLLLPLTIVFGFSAILAGAMRLLLLWASTRLSFATGADLGISIYRRTLYQPYSVHVSRNSSSVINAISTKVGIVINNMVMPVLTISSAMLMISAIMVALLSVNSLVAIAAMGGFTAIYGGIVTINRRRLLTNSRRIAHESTQVIKSLQEGLGGIRDVLLDGSQEVFSKIYRNADIPLRRAQANNVFISQSPRFGMEALGMLMIAILAYLLSQGSGGITNAVPVLGALALGAQRMLPVLQQAYAAWSGLQGGRVSLEDTLELLDQPLPDYALQRNIEPLAFDNQISLRKLGFRYNDESPWIFRNLDITIKKGNRIGFVGVTGSGKSTLIDIIMGLLQPTDGNLIIDNDTVTSANHRSWQAHIAHVPQSIFLTDASVEENIAFGVARADIDRDRVVQAARQAQIAEVVESWPNGYQTHVGERGIRLSGGQRQRIGIARALYKQADVIIFDEATSALDNETEKAVMKAIEGLGRNLTVLIVAHRLTTLRGCDLVVELGEGAIKRSGSYAEMVNQAA